MAQDTKYILAGVDRSLALIDALPEQLSGAAFQEISRLDNCTYFAASVNAAQREALCDAEFLPIRQFLTEVDDALKQITVRALQILHWDARHQHCGACGSELVQKNAQHEKHCPECDTQFHPALSPAVIVLIRKGDEVLLARSPHFPPDVYGLVAGYVDAGESAEASVHREIDEEVGLKVKNIEYFGSQCWPFPSSLMLGFTADYVEGEISLNDGELETASWFNKDSLPKLPIKASIAHQMIDAWKNKT